MVGSPERQAGGEKDIRKHQIHQKDVCHCCELLILVDDEEDQPVSEVTQEEVDIVEHWDQFCTKLINSLFCTQLDSFTDHVAWVSCVIRFIHKLQEELILIVIIIHG
ncbi:hypothetical protein AMECASPLE_025525 [Ameca splendens]|uniref:Uncharacterized protein n=1 Tax=Ameca splendens TaxID=208324 RepID=A0ABV0YS74_9TELE